MLLLSPAQFIYSLRKKNHLYHALRWFLDGSNSCPNNVEFFLFVLQIYINFSPCQGQVSSVKSNIFLSFTRPARTHTPGSNCSTPHVHFARARANNTFHLDSTALQIAVASMSSPRMPCGSHTGQKWDTRTT